MKLHPSSILLSLGLLALTPIAHAADSGFKSIFNGKDLSGWEGKQPLWSVRDGAITGQTKDEKDLPTSNTFLVWKGGEPANFELRLKFKLTGENEKKQANSGVQYRSRLIDPAEFVVGGYQADIDTGRYIGMLYEERGRGILMQPGQKIRIAPSAADPSDKADKGKKAKQKASVEAVSTVTTPEEIAASYKFGEWNELRIVAKGNHVQHFVNGKLTADVTDNDPALAPKSGVIALQLHRGPPMTAQFKDIQLKTLP
jgi:hypothetical protein